MGLPYPSQFRHLEGLLFVTTEDALARLGDPDQEPVQETNPNYRAESIDSFRGIVDDDYLLFVDGDPVDFEKLRARLNREPAVKGVVILGDYATLPPRQVLVVSGSVPRNATGNLAADEDDWTVWSDDLYGDDNGDTVAEKPVSRLPIVPYIGGILGDERRDSNLAIPLVGGLRSKDMAFADELYFRFLEDLEPGEIGEMPMAPPKEAVSPAAGADDIDSGQDLAAECLYLPLHSDNLAKSPFQGDGLDVDAVDAITLEILGTSWETRGVTFAGACWGALIGSTAMLGHQPADAWAAADSVALSFVDRGATAFVGFTALHYVPYNDNPRGGALHCAFWKNIVERGWSPAQALHEARLRFMADTGTRSLNTYLRAIDLKTFWSASCLGLGWHAEPEALDRKPHWLASVRMS